MMHTLPSRERLDELFYYEDGKLFNRVTRTRAVAGCRAGGNGRSGAGKPVRTIQVDGVRYLEHRVIAHMFGLDVSDQIDHINGDPLDNRVENLRAATCSENLRNMRCKNDLGFGGVHFDKGRGKYVAYANPKTGFKNLGRFDNLIDAVAARMRYNRENGYSERHGR